MRPVGDWSVAVATRNGRPVSDLLLYALQKIYITGELGLLDREAVANYLDRLTTLALRICPTELRDELRANLASMRMSRTTTAARVDVPLEPIRMPTMSNVPLPVVDEDAEMAKRFALIVDRLQKQAQTSAASGQQAAPADQQTFAQLLTMAASRSQSGQQFNDYVKMIQPLAGGKEGNVFVILGGAMPSWDMPSYAPGEGMAMPAQVGAMEKIIDLAENPTVTMTRFRELVTAAIQKFNEGALAATLWMFDVASRSSRFRIRRSTRFARKPRTRSVRCSCGSTRTIARVTARCGSRSNFSRHCGWRRCSDNSAANRKPTAAAPSSASSKRTASPDATRR